MGCCLPVEISLVIYMYHYMTMSLYYMTQHHCVKLVASLQPHSGPQNPAASTPP
eukprot:SAG22_NODE_1511_length_4257_cov_10.774651_5_plen_54_part_00